MRFTFIAIAGPALLFFTAGVQGESKPSREANPAYPMRPVRIIAASPATTGDLLARHLAQRLNERWGQPVIVENRAGAGAGQAWRRASVAGH